MNGTNQMRPGVWMVAATAIASGLLLSAGLFFLNLRSSCAVPVFCDPAGLAAMGASAPGAGLLLLISLISWGLILIPAGYAIWYFRKFERLVWPLSLGFVLLAAILVLRLSSTPGSSSAAMQGTAFGIVLLSQAIVITVLGWITAAGATARPAGQAGISIPSDGAGHAYRISLAALAGVFLTLVSGVLLSMRSGTTPCAPGFPCPPAGGGAAALDWFQIVHWAIVGATGLVILTFTVVSWREHAGSAAVLVPVTALAVLFFAQILIGGLAGIRAGDADLLSGLHSLASAGVWSLGVFLVVRAASSSQTAAGTPAAAERIGALRPADFLKLTKPIIVLLLLLTTFSGMVIASGGLPVAGIAFWTVLGGALAAGGSGAINQYIDRGRDRLMSRTARRPIAAGRILPAEGLAFGVALCLISVLIMAIFVNPLAALLTLAGIIYYVYFYSILLKTATVQNIVIGGGAGAIPPLVGWAAVTGSLTAGALMLFVVIFMWTPPHFWALALVRRKDYARAGVPMLPVIRGELETRRQIFIYSVILVLITLTLPAFGLGGAVYLALSALLGIWLLHTAWKVLRIGGNKVAWKMYRYSSMYLAFLFLALVADTLIG